jgi:hypothetical protein
VNSRAQGPTASGDNDKETSMNPARKALMAGALAGTALLGGALGANMFGAAGAQTGTRTEASGSTAAPDPGHGPHVANGITETELTGDDASKAIAAAQAAVPDASMERAETDAEGAAYEVHMTKSDGSEITVKLDSNFQVTGTVNGRG